MSLLIRGSKGTAVKSLQENLTRLGYPAEPDGVYGAGTEKAVREFQDSYGLDADGKAGDVTLGKIDELIAEVTQMKNEGGGSNA